MNLTDVIILAIYDNCDNNTKIKIIKAKQWSSSIINPYKKINFIANYHVYVLHVREHRKVSFDIYEEFSFLVWNPSIYAARMGYLEYLKYLLITGEYSEYYYESIMRAANSH